MIIFLFIEYYTISSYYYLLRVSRKATTAVTTKVGPTSYLIIVYFCETLEISLTILTETNIG
jgi:hypothetical protein